METYASVLKLAQLVFSQMPDLAMSSWSLVPILYPYRGIIFAGSYLMPVLPPKISFKRQIHIDVEDTSCEIEHST